MHIRKLRERISIVLVIFALDYRRARSGWSSYETE